MNKYLLVALSVSGGLLSSLAWSGWCPGLILLVSFIPFFIIEDYLFNNRNRYSSTSFFTFILPGFLIFSIMTVGWIREASIIAAIFVVLGISFIMAFTMWLAHFIRLRSGNIAGLISMISFWLVYEYLSLNIDIISPWINLGNGLAKDILFIQWYDITGTAGGTLWILLSNLVLSAFFVKYTSGEKRSVNWLLLWLTIIIIPSVYSVYRFNSIRENDENANEVVIIQPNIDPYVDKFRIPFGRQLRKVLEMSESAPYRNTGWIITPETTVDDPVDEVKPYNNKYTGMVIDFVEKHPRICFVTGMTSYKAYRSVKDPPSGGKGKINYTRAGYLLYNSAFSIDTGEIAIYHKSKLVPGIEKQFAAGPGKIIGRLLPYLGGTQSGYTAQEERTVFEHPASHIKAAPIICYESAFGKYVTEYVKKGANFLIIITNDGWWKNTSGYKQHLSFASLRAIETRRAVARAANTGISCIIDKKGRILLRSEWWKPFVLKGFLNPETFITPYVKYGDWLMKIAVFISLSVFIIVFTGQSFNRKVI